MINELIILLSDKQQQELIKRANQDSYEDDLAYLQLHLDEWLRPERDPNHMEKTKFSDYDIWFKPCEKCGYDTGKASKDSPPRCWKCGSRINRDYTERALKK